MRIEKEYKTWSTFGKKIRCISGVKKEQNCNHSQINFATLCSKNMTSKVVTFVSLLLAVWAAVCCGQECAKLYGQCGGRNFNGPSCCIQPTPVPGIVNHVADDANTCFKDNAFYSQCRPRCPRDKPCFHQNSICVASIGGTDGFGRQYCGMGQACVNPDWCYSDPISCICGGDVPCRLTSRPGGCRAPRPHPSDPSVCGPGLALCPGYEGDQCGGQGHKEPTTCQPGLTCVKQSVYFSSCQRA